MSVRAGERQAAALLREVDLPWPFDPAAFCERVAEHRGRPLVLVPQPTGVLSEAVGLLVGLRDHDEIHYLADTSSYHQQAIVLHELGHMVCEHAGVHEPLPLALLGDDWDPQVLERLRGRHRYLDDEELQAEGFATAVLDRVDRDARQGRPPAQTPAPQGRLASMFLQ